MSGAASSFSIAPGATLGALLKQTSLDPVDARALVMHGLQLTRVQLITQDERVIDADAAQRLETLFRRRIAGEPIAYIVGTREFYGLEFDVAPAVLIPRPETELLVELALEHLPVRAGVLDMGTGSGAIAVSIAHARPDAAVMALDVSPEALAIARRNAARHGAKVAFACSDWYAALGTERFDVIVSNPPYIASGDIHLAQGDLRFEPLDALTDHGDGLTALRAIIGGSAAHLNPGGWLLMEHGYDQADAVRALLSAHGFCDVRSWQDLAGIERVSGGFRTA